MVIIKYIYILLCIFLISACSDDKSFSNSLNQGEEAPVIFTPIQNTNLGLMNKNTKKDVQITFINPRNEDITILIPNMEKDWYHFSIDTNYDKCKAKSQCVIKLTSIIKDYAPMGNNFGYISLSLLNNSEFKHFINLNSKQNFQEALKYLTNRIYVKSKFLVTIE